MEEFNPNTDVIPIAPTSTLPKKKTAVGKALSAVGNFSVGFGKGALDTISSVPRNVKKVGDAFYDISVTPEFTKAKQSINDQNNHILDMIANVPKEDPKYQRYMELVRQNLDQLNTLNEDEKGSRDSYESSNKGFNTLSKASIPSNKAQSAGFGVEKVAEFFIPAGAIAKADKGLKSMQVVNNSTKAGKIVNATTRIGTRAALEGFGAGATSIAQSGYQGRFDNKDGAKDAIKDAGTASIVAGSLKGLFAGAGELIKSANIPKKLYNQVYKETASDADEWFRNAGTEKGSRTTSDWVLEKKIKGSLVNQAKQVRIILEKSEADVVKAADASGVKIKTPIELKKLAIGLKEEYAGHGRGEIAGQIDEFIKQANKGEVSVREGLQFRRFLDGLRKRTSFRNPKVGDDLAYWANDLRNQINAVNDIGQLNKDYAFAIKAAESLKATAKSSNNQKVIGAIESYFEGGAIVAGEGLSGLGVIGAKRIVQSAGFQSNLAQGLNNLGNSSKAGIGTRALIGKKASDLNNEKFTQ